MHILTPALFLIKLLHLLDMIVHQRLRLRIIQVDCEPIIIYTIKVSNTAPFLQEKENIGGNLRLRPVAHPLHPYCQNWSPASLESMLACCHSPRTSSRVSFDTVPRLERRAASVSQPYSSKTTGLPTLFWAVAWSLIHCLPIGFSSQYQLNTTAYQE